MNRRAFLQISATALLPVLLGLFPKKESRRTAYKIDVLSNRSFGHLLREHSATKPSEELATDYIIVGGGVAGLSAAMGLKGQRFLLFEADDRLGGSSASSSWESVHFALGAHYDLAYPENYGSEVLKLLRQMNLIAFNPLSGLHEFTEKQYLISVEKMEQCYIRGTVRPDVLDGAAGMADFNRVLSRFRGKMPLPTRLIGSELHYLNNITFKDFLQQEMHLPDDLEQRISYQMLDDWGGKCDEVSALAGIHYYMCRPYDEKDIELFSPPQGNSYFVERMVGQLKEPDCLFTGSLVRSIREVEHGVEAEILATNGTVKLVKARGLVFAGQKHTLKYILQAPAPITVPEYAPWVVINFVCRGGLNFTKWQNDVLTNELHFLGFVNSIPQHSRSEDYDVLTAYYCFQPRARAALVDIEKDPSPFVEATLDLIAETTQVDVRDYLQHVSVNLMGHAMPVPSPGYLSFANVPQVSERIVLAGVDTGRLPLFFEACDSGLQAAATLLKNTMPPDLKNSI